MPSVDLAPIAKTDQKFRSFLETQFRRLGDSIEEIPDFDSGILTVTGSVEIVTGVINIDEVIACLADPPVAGACFIRAISVNEAENRGTDSGNILIDVYSNTFAISTVPKRVAWIALGTNRVD